MNNADPALATTQELPSLLSNEEAFALKTEEEFAHVTESLFRQFLCRNAITDSRVSEARYYGIVDDKPGLLIRVGDAEFHILIMKS